jgi:hypothetical protein
VLQYDDSSVSKVKLGLGTSPALKNSTFEAIIVAGISDNTLASPGLQQTHAYPPAIHIETTQYNERLLVGSKHPGI